MNGTIFSISRTQSFQYFPVKIKFCSLFLLGSDRGERGREEENTGDRVFSGIVTNHVALKLFQVDLDRPKKSAQFGNQRTNNGMELCKNSPPHPDS